MPSGFSMATVPIAGDGVDRPWVVHTSLTDALGALATEVDGYRMSDGGNVSISAAFEQVCIPIDTTDEIRVDGMPVVGTSISRIPSGMGCSLRSEATTSIAVIGAPAPEADEDEVTTIDLETCSYPMPSTSDVRTARLTEALGCTGMKANARLLRPGQHVPYHTEGNQEELFVPIRGSCSMRIEGSMFETPPGTIVRVAPKVPRSALNEGEEEALWVMIGAPPTGAPDEWDPGATILE